MEILNYIQIKRSHLLIYDKYIDYTIILCASIITFQKIPLAYMHDLAHTQSK